MKIAKVGKSPVEPGDPKPVFGLAFLLLFGALLLLVNSHPVIVFHQSYRWAPSEYEEVAPGELRLFGLASLAASFFLFRFYFSLRKQARRRTRPFADSAKIDSDGPAEKSI